MSLAAIAGASKALQKTSAGTQFGRALFDPARQASITPGQITQILKSIGVNVPPAVSVTVDAAQIIIAGGAFASDVAQGASIAQFANPVSAILNGVLDIFEVTGLLDPKSPPAQVLKFGTEVALVVASGGLNVIADIALVLDLLSNLFFPPDDRPHEHALLQSLDRQAANDWWNSRERGQASVAAALFQDYQHGKLSTFEMLGAVADQSPDLFLNYFPDFKGFIPPIAASLTWTVSGDASYGGFLGIGRNTDTITENYTLNYSTIQHDKQYLKDIFLRKYILDPFEPYRVIQAMTKSQVLQYGYPQNAKRIGVFDHQYPVFPRMRLVDLAILSMFPPYFQFIRDDFDIKPYLMGLNLTPSDMGFSVLQDEIGYGELGTNKIRLEPAMTINGVEWFTPQARITNRESGRYNADNQRAKAMDLGGNIRGLLKVPRAERIITEWGIQPYVPGAMEDSLPPIYSEHDDPRADPKGYRNIRNYWSAIATADKMRNDPYFNSQDFRTVNQFLDTVNYIEEKHRTLQFTVVGKGMNLQARKNIAGFYGIPPSKLKMAPAETGKPAKVIL